MLLHLLVDKGFMNSSENLHNDSPEDNKVVGNTVAAVTLLKDWLSISESQICSTEVLSEQLPRINDLLETSMNSISDHFSVVATNAKKVNELLHHIDESEDKGDSIYSSLQKLANESADDSMKEKLFDLANQVKGQGVEVHKQVHESQEMMETINQKIGKIIVDMQFQDRVSQNIVITINIMKAIVEYLDKELTKSLPDLTKDERCKLLDMDFAKNILEQFRLGELQNAFVSHLLDHGYIKESEDIGYSFKAEKNEQEDDVDLF